MVARQLYRKDWIEPSRIGSSNMTAVSKNKYIKKLDNIVDKYDNTCHRTIKMKSTGFNSGTYIKFDVENNEKDPKLNVGNHVRILQYKIIC